MADGSCRARSRSEEDVMLIHHNDEVASNPHRLGLWRNDGIVIDGTGH